MTDNLIFMDPFPRNEAMVYTPGCAAALAKMGRVVAHWGSRAPDDLVEAHLADMTILIGQTAMPKQRLDRAPKLRAILNVKANWEDNVDYAECHARGIQVLSAAPAMAPAFAPTSPCPPGARIQTRKETHAVITEIATTKLQKKLRQQHGQTRCHRLL